MAQSLRFTTATLEGFPDDGNRYEIIDGELYASPQPDWRHQTICGRIFAALDEWDRQTGLGNLTLMPGVIFSEDTAVAPDVAWISAERLAATLDAKYYLHTAPELVIEVLSPVARNEERDRETKLNLYTGRGVLEYWIVDWRKRKVLVYQRHDLTLWSVGTLNEPDVLTSPILPGFTYPLERLFTRLP
jgi:Uma2 family endonuclease